MWMIVFGASNEIVGLVYQISCETSKIERTKCNGNQVIDLGLVDDNQRCERQPFGNFSSFQLFPF